MKEYGRVAVQNQVFLISALVGGEWSVSQTDGFITWGKSPRYPLERWQGGPQSRSGQRGEQENLASTGTRTTNQQGTY
jgi:hypothetical protein